MIKLYTSIGEYATKINDDGSKQPSVILMGKEYYLSIPEMILWTKGMWNICSHDLLIESFRQEELKLGDMNFDFILNRLIQRGLILSAKADTDTEAFHMLIDDLVVYAADVSMRSQIKAFLLMVFMSKVPVKYAKTVFKSYVLTDIEKFTLNLARSQTMTTRELFCRLNLDNTAALALIANLHSRKLIRFSNARNEVAV